MTDDLRVLTCNYRGGTSVHAAGAKAYVLRVNGGDPDRPVLLARSRSGRWVQRYEDRRRLHNFRVTTVPSQRGTLYLQLRRFAVPGEQLLEWWRPDRDTSRDTLHG